MRAAAISAVFLLVPSPVVLSSPTTTVATTAPILAGGGLTIDAVPALVAAGVTGLHVGSAVRDSWDAPVDAARVREWRRLISRQ